MSQDRTLFESADSTRDAKAPGFVQHSGALARKESVVGVEFDVHLDNFDGPFDLLLALIAKHELDLTEVALSAVTDDFVAYVMAAEAAAAENPHTVLRFLSAASEFLVVATTLLDLKIAALLPGSEHDESYHELLEARDILFARLLQYRAYKEIAALLGANLTVGTLSAPHVPSLDPEIVALLPELIWTTDSTRFAELAARALALPSQRREMTLDHIHASTVSVREQAAAIMERLRRDGTASFTDLADGQDRLTVVARFLGLLELFREATVSFIQPEPFAELDVTWTDPEHNPAHRSEQHEEEDAA